MAEQGTKDFKTFRKQIREGKSITAALVSAGYSEKQARKGRALFKGSQGLASAYQHAVADLTAEVKPPEIRARIARNRLTNNVLNGVDEAVNSCKLLMQDKEVDILRPDSISGVIVIEAPRSQLPVLEASTTIDATQIAAHDTATT